MGSARQLLGGKERPSRPQSPHDHGRRRLRHLDAAVRHRALFGPPRLDWRSADLRLVRDLPGDLRRPRLRDALGDPGLSRLEDPAQRASCRLVGAVVVVRAWNDHRARGRAVVRASRGRPGRPAVRVRGNRAGGRGVDRPVASQRPRRAQDRAWRGDELSLARDSADGRQRGRRDPAASPAAAEVERPAHPLVDRRRGRRRPRPGGDADLPRFLRDRPASPDAVGVGGTGIDRDDGRGGRDARRAMGPDSAARARPRAR